jgi:hypothetical protein
MREIADVCEVEEIDGTISVNTIDRSWTQANCVLTRLEAPRAVVARVEVTRALDGMQEASWSGPDGSYEAFWNYHSDSGLNITIAEA